MIKSRITAKYLIEELQKFKVNSKILSVELVPLGEPVSFRINSIVNSIKIDDINKNIILSNNLSSDGHICNIDNIIDKIKDYLEYDIVIEVLDKNYNTVFKDYANDCYFDFDGLRDCIQLFSITNSDKYY